MSALLEGARKMLRRGDALGERVEALGSAVGAARGRLDDDLLDRADGVVQRAGSRLRLSADHTVVALAGATGSGKSSTFNAITGLDLAAVGVRRPTTSWATACIWGANGAAELLEWLGIPARHQVVRDSMLDANQASGDLQGLVLLDLPDHDSTEVSHHLEVERLVTMADLMVWVLDPQKYADAAVHDRFLKPLARHKDVMLVVLNHIDAVPEARRPGMISDVHKLLESDGLAGVPVIATSARTGEGMVELRQAIARRVADKAATRTRFSNDVTATAEELIAQSGDAKPPSLDDKDVRDVVTALSEAAGVPVVVDAVRRATTIRARRATGFPLTSWISRLRPDPLKRLHLDLGRDGKDGKNGTVSGRDIVTAARSSMPEANQVQQAKVESAVRDLADRVGSPLTPAWSRSVRRASTARFDDLRDSLDQAVTGTDLGVTRTPGWCQAVRVLQWVLLVSAIAGAAWLGALAVMGYLKMPEPETPHYLGLPVPTLMLLGGILLGVLLALLSRALISLAARSRAHRADRKLRDAVGEVAAELVVAPIRGELDAYRITHDGLRSARG